MKLYISSYKLGDQVRELKRLVPSGNKKTAYIPNALDFSEDIVGRKKSEHLDIAELKALGLAVEMLDLRQFFGRQALLERKAREFGVFWARGGNTFVLRSAMSLSGFDKVLRDLSPRKDLLYGGYSAGVCVLAPSLRGIHLMDKLAEWPYGSKSRTIWAGLGLVGYSIVPHYKSDHPESLLADKAAAYMKRHKMPFRTLRDGEVIVDESRTVEV